MNTARNNSQQPQRAIVSEPNKVEFIRNLAAIQDHLKVGKNQQNTYGGFNYRNASDILAAVKPILREFGYFMRVNSEIIEMAGNSYVKTTVTITDGFNEEFSSGMAREIDQKKGMDASQLTGAAITYSKKYALENLFCIDNNQDADSWDNRPQQQPQRQNNRQYQGNGNRQVQQHNNQPYQNNPQPQQPQQNPGYEFQQPSPQQPQQANPQTRAAASVITPNQVQKLRNGMRMADVTEERFCRAAKIERIGLLTQDRVKYSVEWLQKKAMQ